MKILLDMGHCLRGYDTGTQGYGKTEQACTREIGYKFKAKMEALGHTVIICSCDSANSVSESLAYRVHTANNTDGYLYIAIHLNSGGGYGTEIFTYGAKAFAEATGTLDGFIALGFTNRGIKDGSHLYVIKNTKMKSMLVECCFMDTNDMNKYNAENFANAIVKGITGQSVSTPAPSITVKPSTYTPVKNGEVTVDTLNIREHATTDSCIVGTLKNGDKVRVAGKVGNFYSIFFGEHGAWVSCDYIKDTTGTPNPSISKPSIPKTGIVTASVLNVRSGAGTGYAIIGSYNKGERVQIARKVGNFYETYFGDHGGWVSCDYVK